MLKSVAKNFSILSLATITEAIITFLFIAFVARQFGSTLFGKYILIGVYVHIVSVLMNAGIAPIALRELARNRDDPSDLFDDLFSLRMVLGIFGYLGLAFSLTIGVDIFVIMTIYILEWIVSRIKGVEVVYGSSEFPPAG